MVSEVFETIWGPSKPSSRNVDDTSLLLILEWRIRQSVVLTEFKEPLPGEWLSECEGTLIIYHLALLVYLERASGVTSQASNTLRSRIHRALNIFSHLKTLQRHFPLLIIGCEARGDEERLIVLDLISRTEQKSSVRSLESVKGLIQSLWAQDDLADQDLNYTEKVRAVMSSRASLPAFV